MDARYTYKALQTRAKQYARESFPYTFCRVEDWGIVITDSGVKLWVDVELTNKNFDEIEEQL